MKLNCEKLNYPRTLLVGLAFLSICAFWQMYDNIVPLILTRTFRMNETASGAIMAADNVLALFLLPFFGALSDRTETRLGKRMPFILFGTVCALALMNLLPLLDNGYAAAPDTFKTAAFVVVLGLLLVAMGVYRSPAVALMPDVTVKPLRSKANAIINLMGAAGGIIILGLGIVFGTGKAANALMSYTLFFSIVAGIMLVSLLVFMLFVKEPQWASEMAAESERLGLEQSDEDENAGDRKLSKAEFISLMLILFSVVFWYMGYNAVTSKYSVYAGSVLNKDYNTTLLIANAAAIVSYLPIGLLSSKFGRKKMILTGVVVLAGSFLAASFLRSNSPAMLMNVLFATAGIGWATINVNSYPMVVELSRGSNVGRYTGFYYTASMAAQVVTPVLSGVFLDIKFTTLFPYATVFVILAFFTMLPVRHGDARPAAKQTMLDGLGGGD